MAFQKLSGPEARLCSVVSASLPTKLRDAANVVNQEHQLIHLENRKLRENLVRDKR